MLAIGILDIVYGCKVSNLYNKFKTRKPDEEKDDTTKQQEEEKNKEYEARNMAADQPKNDYVDKVVNDYNKDLDKYRGVAQDFQKYQKAVSYIQ